MAADKSYQQFVQLLEKFISGRDRSPSQIAMMEGEFSKYFDDDPRFADLQYELAMFGADDHKGDADLVKECKRALKLLRADLRQA
jgi:hypothetical protein